VFDPFRWQGYWSRYFGADLVCDASNLAADIVELELINAREPDTRLLNHKLSLKKYELKNLTCL